MGRCSIPRCPCSRRTDPHGVPSLPLITASTIDVGGRSVEFALAGEGGPPTVLVNGSGGHLDAWFQIFAPLSGDGQLLAYNRPGIGRSAGSAEPQTAAACAADLIALLDVLRIEAPILAVGHSFGGLIVNHLARVHPARVAAAVLLDASTAEDIRETERHHAEPRLIDRIGALFSPRQVHGEIAHGRASADALEDAGRFPPIPLAVVSGARSARGLFVPRAFGESRARNQHALADLSPLGGQIIAERSGHFPQMSEPALVIDTINTMRRQLREEDTK